jgi:pyrroline-5-carboxylate reductase
MTDTNQIGVIGGGNMAEAILSGILSAQVAQAQQIIVSEPKEERRAHLSDRLGVTCVDDNLQAASQMSVLLAVKPQVLPGVLEEVASSVHPEAVIMTIAAGVPTSRIDSLLGGCGKIIRIMPNTPMLVGAGISALSAGPRTDLEDMNRALGFFGACGETVLVDEEKMDAVTAVSGSGPAYVFYLVEAMIAAGQAEGLGPETAHKLAVETVFGSARLLQQGGEDPERLRARVTSPNGTTQRAIETMEASGVMEALVQAIRAAAHRSRELARGD